MLLSLPIAYFAFCISIATAAGSFPAKADDNLLQIVRLDERQRVEVMDRAARSVVCIFNEDRIGVGSGVVITAEGYGLTNFHVIADLLESRYVFGGLSDGKFYPLQILGIDPTGDVAMFKLTGKDRFDAAPLGDSDQVCVGQEVFAMGNPFMLAEDNTPTVTYGMVSGIHRYQFGLDTRSLVYTDCIQVDASINPGNSGGPLFDMEGQVIGINGRALFKHRGRVNLGLGFAISINQIKRFIPGLRAGLLVEHGTLGASTVDSSDGRVLFDKVLDHSPASAAGIQVGDRLVRCGGREIHSSNQFINILGTYPAGWSVEILFEHDNQRMSRTIRLSQLPAELPPELQKKFKVDESVTTAQAQRILASNKKPRSPEVHTSAFSQAIDKATRCVVKIYGAGIAAEQGYGTGVVVSPDGRIVTVLSLLLEATDLRVVTHDGHIYRAQVAYRDENRQLAMLKVRHAPTGFETDAAVDQQNSFVAYPMGDSSTLKRGDWILAVGNPFKVAEGAEPVSVLKGTVSGRSQLNAVHGTEPFPYRGEVLLIDAITSSPGTAGSALVDISGQWVGLVGKMVTCKLTNTYVNYAYPIEEIQAFIADSRSGTGIVPRPSTVNLPRGYHGIRLSKIGYRRQLPFVKEVTEDSPAAKAGVLPNDLIVSANGIQITRAPVFNELCEGLHVGDELSLVIRRGKQLIPIRMTLTEPPK